MKLDETMKAMTVDGKEKRSKDCSRAIRYQDLEEEPTKETKLEQPVKQEENLESRLMEAKGRKCFKKERIIESNNTNKSNKMRTEN